MEDIKVLTGKCFTLEDVKDDLKAIAQILSTGYYQMFTIEDMKDNIKHFAEVSTTTIKDMFTIEDLKDNMKLLVSTD